MTIRRNAVLAAVLSFAALAFAAPAVGDGGGDKIELKTERELVVIEERLEDTLRNLRPRSRDEAEYRSKVRTLLLRVRDELKWRQEVGSATPAAPSAAPAASSATPAAPTPPAQAAAPPLTPPTASTPEPTASSGNCRQPGAACADDEARSRQARKAETKRAQAAGKDWAEQQGFIKR
jgi:hypothetical protein